MPSYVILINFTDQGIRSVKETVANVRTTMMRAYAEDERTGIIGKLG